MYLRLRPPFTCKRSQTRATQMFAVSQLNSHLGPSQVISSHFGPMSIAFLCPKNRKQIFPTLSMPSANSCTVFFFLSFFFPLSDSSEPTQGCDWCGCDFQVVRPNLTLVAAAEAVERIYVDLSHLICIRRRRTGGQQEREHHSHRFARNILDKYAEQKRKRFLSL